MSHLHFNLATKQLVVDGASFSVQTVPVEAEGVSEIRVHADGTIESFSERDWVWKPAPELGPLVAHLQEHAEMALASRVPRAIPVVK